MNSMKINLTAIIVALIAVAGTVILSNAYKYKYKVNESITVTGSAEKDFISDNIVWSGDYVRKNMELKAAYVSIKSDESEIRKYLQGKGVKEEDVIFSSVSINKDYDTKYDANGRITGSVFTGYSLMQTVTVDSKEIDKVEKISREITELIEDGIELNSRNPDYYYSKLSEIKLDLLKKAAVDARQRAEIIAANSGGALGSIRKSNMGVFQITGQNSNEDYSYGGTFNTSSKNKTATITVRAEYAIQ